MTRYALRVAAIALLVYGLVIIGTTLSGIVLEWVFKLVEDSSNDIVAVSANFAAVGALFGLGPTALLTPLAVWFDRRKA